MSFYQGRRNFMNCVGAAGLSVLATSHALAQQNVKKIVVGFPPGGSADSIGRLMANLMSDPSTSFVVENKPGASSQIAADAVRRAVDGSSIFITPSSGLSLVPQLYKTPMFNSLEDFVPVGGICDHAFALAVTGNSPIKTVAEFIEAAKKNPNDANYATAGPGTGMHFLGTLFSQETGVKLTHIPYKGTAPGLQDLIGGQIFSSFNPLPTMIDLHKAEKIRILAVSSPARVSSLPNIPTFNELGLPALEMVEWYGAFVSSKTPPAVLKTLQQQLARALVKPEMAATAKKLELDPKPIDPEILKKLLESDYKRWTSVVRKTGISLDN